MMEDYHAECEDIRLSCQKSGKKGSLYGIELALKEFDSYATHPGGGAAHSGG